MLLIYIFLSYHLSAALGKLLLQCGFSHWDLGMEMEYKLSLGADLVARSDFVREVHRTRVEDKDLVLRCNNKTIIVRRLSILINPTLHQKHQSQKGNGTVQNMNSQHKMEALRRDHTKIMEIKYNVKMLLYSCIKDNSHPKIMLSFISRIEN